MTVDEKLGEVVLIQAGPYENMQRRRAPTVHPGPDPPGRSPGRGLRCPASPSCPAPLGVAATFDPELARAYGQVEGARSRRARASTSSRGPTLNIDRVPQSGRTYEGFGEDPLLVAAMGVADIEGIQSTGTMAMAKHFAVYNQETDRGVLNDQVLRPGARGALPPAVRGRRDPGPRCHGDVRLSPTERHLPVPGPVAARPAGHRGGSPDSSARTSGRSTIPVAALEAGTDLIKPARVRTLADLVHKGRAAHRRGGCGGDHGAHRHVRRSRGGPVRDRHPGRRRGHAVAHQARPRRGRTIGGPPEGPRIDPAPRRLVRRSVAVIGADASGVPVTTGLRQFEGAGPVHLHAAGRHPASGRSRHDRAVRRRREHDG